MRIVDAFSKIKCCPVLLAEQMRTILGLLLILIASLPVIAQQTAQQTAQQMAETIYYNGRIITMWDARPVVEAVAISGNRFLKAG